MRLFFVFQVFTFLQVLTVFAFRKAFVRDGEPTVFNVLVNASGILKFSLASTQPDCE